MAANKNPELEPTGYLIPFGKQKNRVHPGPGT